MSPPDPVAEVLVLRQRGHCKRQTNLLDLFSQIKNKSNVLVSNITDGPSVQRNDTGTDKKPVATLNQEHPIVISQSITVYCRNYHSAT